MHIADKESAAEQSVLLSITFRNWADSIQVGKFESERIRLEAEQRALSSKMDAQRLSAAGSLMRNSEAATMALCFRQWRDNIVDAKLNEAMAAQSELEA